MQIFVLGFAGWFVVSIVVGLFIGRVIGLQDEPEVAAGVNEDSAGTPPNHLKLRTPLVPAALAMTHPTSLRFDFSFWIRIHGLRG